MKILDQFSEFFFKFADSRSTTFLCVPDFPQVQSVFHILRDSIMHFLLLRIGGEMSSAALIVKKSAF